MTDAEKLVPTWLYDATGGSRLIDLAEGAEAPKGWFFAPPAGVVLAGDTASPATPPTPPTASERLDVFELRLMKLESQIGSLMQTVSMMQSAPQEAKTSDRDALVARAKALNLEFHGRLGDDKLRALIAEAEARPPSDAEAKPTDDV